MSGFWGNNRPGGGAPAESKSDFARFHRPKFTANGATDQKFVQTPMDHYYHGTAQPHEVQRSAVLDKPVEPPRPRSGLARQLSNDSFVSTAASMAASVNRSMFAARVVPSLTGGSRMHGATVKSRRPYNNSDSVAREGRIRFFGNDHGMAKSAGPRKSDVTGKITEVAPRKALVSYMRRNSVV
eukprot:GEMP01048755.1.p2 GENE.GEMP01048755.1~~GEMP01048755.1.p2  ORF type:complete len:183 (+),score=51.72 GEMP01048755.1:268-816(+)